MSPSGFCGNIKLNLFNLCRLTPLSDKTDCDSHSHDLILIFSAHRDCMCCNIPRTISHFNSIQICTWSSVAYMKN